MFCITNQAQLIHTNCYHMKTLMFRVQTTIHTLKLHRQIILNVTRVELVLCLKDHRGPEGNGMCVLSGNIVGFNDLIFSYCRYFIG